MLPHLARLKAASQYLSLHANAALKAGDRETALEDLKLQFRLIEAIRQRADPDLPPRAHRHAANCLAAGLGGPG